VNFRFVKSLLSKYSPRRPIPIVGPVAPAVVAVAVLLAVDDPPAFTATTRYSYVVPADRPTSA
jgi:hypothetical protein